MLETGSTPVIPTAPPLNRASPTGNFVRDALYLAVRESQVGEPAKARNAIKNAILQKDMISDTNEKAYWDGQITEVTNFVEANAAQAEALRIASQQADATYVRGQALTPSELQAQVGDNVDLQRALDAEAAGDEPSLAYNGIPNPGNFTGKFVATVNPEGAAQAGIKSQPASVSDLPSTVKYLLVAGLLATVLFVAGYAYVARSVTA